MSVSVIVENRQIYRRIRYLIARNKILRVKYLKLDGKSLKAMFIYRCYLNNEVKLSALRNLKRELERRVIEYAEEFK
jgi:hypothetical protein